MRKTKKPRKFNLSAYCTREVYEKAKRLADAEGRPISGILRLLVERAAEPGTT